MVLTVIRAVWTYLIELILSTIIKVIVAGTAFFSRRNQMTRNHVLTALLWFRKTGFEITELDFFQAAYFWKYEKAEPRCMWCFNEYIRHGTVPDFVVEFVREFVTNPRRLS